MTSTSENYSSQNTALAGKSLPCTSRAEALRRVRAIITHPHFSPYKVLVARQQRTVVILNPKVGTTSFRHLITRAYQEVLGHRDPSDGHYKPIKKARQFPFASLRDYYHAFSHPEEYDFYCFVRNPYSRLKSAWVDKFAFGHQTGYPRSIRGKLIRQLRHFARSHDLAGGDKNSQVPFTTFVDYVAAQETGKRNHHWDAQHSVLMMDRIHYSQIFKMETQFAPGMTTIFARLGITEGWISEAMEKPQNESRKITESIFTPELAEQTRRIYARDFALFDYDVDSWKGK